MSLGQKQNKIDLNQFCSIVPGTKPACLLGISPTFCPVKQKFKPWNTHSFSCVGGMDHAALHQREKNFSCLQAFNFLISSNKKVLNFGFRDRVDDVVVRNCDLERTTKFTSYSRTGSYVLCGQDIYAYDRKTNISRKKLNKLINK